MIRQRGRLAPGGIVAHVNGQDEPGCSARVVSGMHAAISETVVPAICRDDAVSARTNDVQLRVAWPGWLSWPAAVAAQRQGVPADQHRLEALVSQCILKLDQHDFAAVHLFIRQSCPARCLLGKIVLHACMSPLQLMTDDGLVPRQASRLRPFCEVAFPSVCLG
jgi:hypothetical protein